MTDQLESLRTGIIDAVQQELTRFSQQVAAEVQRLRADLANERAARMQTDEHVHALAAGVQSLGQLRPGDDDEFRAELVRSLEERLSEFSTLATRRHDEISARIGRVVDEASIGLAASVEAAARPMVQQLEHRQDQVETDLRSLDRNLRKFDEQGARMVAHVNQVTTAVEARLEELTTQMTVEFDQRLAALVTRVDEVSAAASRQQVEVSNLVGDRVERAEDRLNDRMLSMEARVNEALGVKVAEIDAHVGRISSTIDATISTLSDRIATVDGRVGTFEDELATVEERMKSVDAEAIDELKEQMSTAVGEAMLVRIEMERLDKRVTEDFDKTAVRMTDLETAIQDATMDVETAVQLERLEEVERALIALDPSQFVRHDQLAATTAVADPGSIAPGDENQAVDAPSANGHGAPSPFTRPPDTAAPDLELSRPG
jgi:prefoldin subunit 5